MLKPLVNLEICTRTRAPVTLFRLDLAADPDALEGMDLDAVRAEVVSGYAAIAAELETDLYVDGVRA